MKFSSAITLTTVASIMSTVHGAPVSNPDPIHHRRHSSVSELSDRAYEGHDFMDSFGAAYEPGNGIGRLLNFVKRQLGSTDSTSTSGHHDGGSGMITTSSVSNAGTASNPSPHNTQTDSTSNAVNGLMGGGLDSTTEAGFAFEPGQSIRTA